MDRKEEILKDLIKITCHCKMERIAAKGDLTPLSPPEQCPVSVEIDYEKLETYKREGVIEELESLKDDLCWYYNSYDDSATDVIDHRISELKK